MKRIVVAIVVVAILGVIAWQRYLFVQRKPGTVQQILTDLN